jgi:hypothetical protein
MERRQGCTRHTSRLTESPPWWGIERCQATRLLARMSKSGALIAKGNKRWRTYQMGNSEGNQK